MATPTQLDRIERAIAALTAKANRLDLQQQQLFSIINATNLGVQIMSQTTDDTKTAVDSLDAKVDALIAAIQPGLQTLRDQLAAAQAQVASLLAGDASDAAALQVTIAAAQAEAAKVDAAIAGLTPAG